MVISCVVLTIILMTMAGTRQKSPGTQQNIMETIENKKLVTNAYFGRFLALSLAPVSVPCVSSVTGC